MHGEVISEQLQRNNHFYKSFIPVIFKKRYDTVTYQYIKVPKKGTRRKTKIDTFEVLISTFLVSYIHSLYIVQEPSSYPHRRVRAISTDSPYESEISLASSSNAISPRRLVGLVSETQRIIKDSARCVSVAPDNGWVLVPATGNETPK